MFVTLQLNPKMPRYTISTMTFSVSLRGCETILRHDIERMRAVTSEFDIQVSKFARNAVALKTIASSVNVKVFPRGSLHVTGCKTVDQLRDVVRRIIDLLTATYDDVTDPCVDSAALNMINIGTAWPFPIGLSRFADACRDMNVFAEQPERPPSCIVRRSATAFVYKSGKMIVTGKTPHACAETCAFVATILDLPPYQRGDESNSPS